MLVSSGMRTIALVAACGVASFVAPNRAEACSPPLFVELQVENAGQTAAPTPPRLTATVNRPTWDGCEDASNSCGPKPWASIAIDVVATDDVTPAAELGFVAEIIGGTGPRNFGVDSRIEVTNQLVRYFDIEDTAGFSMQLAVRAVDTNGNASSATVIAVTEAASAPKTCGGGPDPTDPDPTDPDPDSDGGCAIGGTSSLLVAVLVGGVLARRRRRP